MASKEPWDFKKQLSVGMKGEKLLLQKWPHAVRKHDALKGPDLVDSRGKVIELKTDTYPIEKTANFFMERYSDASVKSPGGIWQAASKGVDVFVYLFINSGRWYVFEDMAALIKRVEELTALKFLHNIPNRGYVTQGYKVRRSDLADLYREEIL